MTATKQVQVAGALWLEVVKKLAKLGICINERSLEDDITESAKFCFRTIGYSGTVTREKAKSLFTIHEVNDADGETVFNEMHELVSKEFGIPCLCEDDGEQYSLWLVKGNVLGVSFHGSKGNQFIRLYLSSGGIMLRFLDTGHRR